MMTTVYGQLNIVTGWIFISLGITTGSILGLWSFAGPFKAPKGHENYTDLPRRLNRLAHIACFMLPLISIVFGQHLDHLPLTDLLKHVASVGMLTCILASFWLPFKYFEIIPVSAGMLALYLMSWANLKIFLNIAG